MRIGYSWGFLLAGASNESGVVDNDNFWRFEWLGLLLWKRLQQSAFWTFKVIQGHKGDDFGTNRKCVCDFY